MRCVNNTTSLVKFNKKGFLTATANRTVLIHVKHKCWQLSQQTFASLYLENNKLLSPYYDK